MRNTAEHEARRAGQMVNAKAGEVKDAAVGRARDVSAEVRDKAEDTRRRL